MHCHQTLNVSHSYVKSLEVLEMEAKLLTILVVISGGILVAIIYSKTSPMKVIQKSGLFSDKLPQKHRTNPIPQTEDIEILWTYSCVNYNCVRSVYSSGIQTSLKTCNMMCTLPQLWPYPKRVFHGDKTLSKFCLKDLHMTHNTTGHVWYLLHRAYNYMFHNLQRLPGGRITNCTGRAINLDIKIQKSYCKLLMNTSEEYNLTITKSTENTKVCLVAETYFGARHGLETLYQLIWWDEVRQSFLLLGNIEIYDAPMYPHRGLMLDTGNNYFSPKSIMNTLMGMAANKLNVFHWHITDFASFPFQAPSYPDLSKYGSYEDSKIYTPADIRKIVKFARFLGIRVIIEIDAPGHMLAGWEAMEGNLVVFIKSHVTGEMNRNKTKTFTILNKLHEDIINLTEEEELFHIGGHPYQTPMNKSQRKAGFQSIQTIYDNLMALNKTQYTILWSSNFTEGSSLLHLDPARTIVQITSGLYSVILEKQYGVIFSVDSYWSLGCGFGFWTPLKIESCYEYVSWQSIYTHSPWNQYDIERVFGGEVTLWSEQVGEDTLDNILWPRTAAFAENIWKALDVLQIPPDVATRLDSQRERLEQLGLDSSVLWPEWCTLNPNSC